MNEKNEDSLRNLCDTNRQTNIQNIRDPRRREKGAESLFKEIITEKFPNLGREMDTLVMKPMSSQIGGAQRGPHQDML